jgi:hypothetical protein
MKFIQEEHPAAAFPQLVEESMITTNKRLPKTYLHTRPPDQAGEKKELPYRLINSRISWISWIVTAAAWPLAD